MLQGEIRAAATAVVDDIVRALLEWFERGTGGPALASVALVFATVSIRRELELNFGAILQKVIDSSATAPMATTWAGSLGYALALQSSLRLLGIDEDVCAPLDAGLDATLAENAGPVTDLIDGATGRLAYLLERPVTPQTERSRRFLLNQLGASAPRDPRAPDLGVAHGAAGVILVLASVIDRGWGESRDVALLTRTVEILLSFEDPSLAPFRFPFVGRGSESRLAWCYGDLGISVALLYAARVLGRHQWEATARRLAESAAAVPVDLSRVNEATLCHGAVGVGTLLSWLAEELDSPTIRASAIEWFERVSRFRRKEGRFAGFQFNRGGVWEDAVTILEGAAGVALGLEAACHVERPEWQRYVLLLPIPR